ncbi:MAG: flagellin [Alkaliphilus sp.]|jgi:flagellin|nr:flagellin [Alkaliphilus sp. AH-315-G20]PHS35399.1 MAG: flagellin [Alkaliphilus sp.]
MRINNNLLAMNTHRQLGMTNASGAKSMEKLSSGFRINRAGDDAAGLSISEKMRGQIRGLNQASRNAQDGISLVQTAEGALSETQAILQRMRELAVQSSNDTNVGADRTAIQNEMDQLATEVTRISNNTEFNERTLLDGGLTAANNSGELTFQIGANSSQNMALGIVAMDSQSLGVAGTSTVGTVTGTGDVTSAEITGSAAAVVDGNVVTATTAEVAATAATVTGSTTPLAATPAEAGDLVISVDGAANFTVAVLDTETLATIITNINTGAGATIATDVGGSLVLTSTTAGTSSNITIDATSTDATAAHLGLNETTTSGTDQSFTITLSDTIRTDSVITGLAIDATAVSGTGDYAGFELVLDGALADAQTNTITLAVTAGTAATFNADGTLLAEAVATTGIDISSQAAADTAISTISTALTSVSTERANLGSIQNRLEHTIKNLDTSSENLQAAESRIRDVDMAKEMMNFTKQNILQQAATAMLAQANQAPQGILQLLR